MPVLRPPSRSRSAAAAEPLQRPKHWPKPRRHRKRGTIVVCLSRMLSFSAGSGNRHDVTMTCLADHPALLAETSHAQIASPACSCAARCWPAPALPSRPPPAPPRASIPPPARRAARPARRWSSAPTSLSATWSRPGPGGRCRSCFADNTELVVGPGSTLDHRGLPDPQQWRCRQARRRHAVGHLPLRHRQRAPRTSTTSARPPAPSACAAPGSTCSSTPTARRGSSCIMAACDLLHAGQAMRGDLRALRRRRDRPRRRDASSATAATSPGRRGRRSSANSVYAENQSALLRQFWMPSSLDCLRTPPRIDPPVRDPNIGKGPPPGSRRDDTNPNGGGSGNCHLRMRAAVRRRSGLDGRLETSTRAERAAAGGDADRSRADRRAGAAAARRPAAGHGASATWAFDALAARSCRAPAAESAGARRRYRRRVAAPLRPVAVAAQPPCDADRPARRTRRRRHRLRRAVSRARPAGRRQ